MTLASTERHRAQSHIETAEPLPFAIVGAVTLSHRAMR